MIHRHTAPARSGNLAHDAPVRMPVATCTDSLDRQLLYAAIEILSDSSQPLPMADFTGSAQCYQRRQFRQADLRRVNIRRTYRGHHKTTVLTGGTAHQGHRGTGITDATDAVTPPLHHAAIRAAAVIECRGDRMDRPTDGDLAGQDNR